jgi:hypothetical protein
MLSTFAFVFFIVKSASKIEILLGIVQCKRFTKIGSLWQWEFRQRTRGKARVSESLILKRILQFDVAWPFDETSLSAV